MTPLFSSLPKKILPSKYRQCPNNFSPSTTVTQIQATIIHLDSSSFLDWSYCLNFSHFQLIAYTAAFWSLKCKSVISLPSCDFTSHLECSLEYFMGLQGPTQSGGSHFPIYLPASLLLLPSFQAHGPSLNMPSLVLLRTCLCCSLCVECSFPSSHGSLFLALHTSALSSPPQRGLSRWPYQKQQLSVLLYTLVYFLDSTY